MFLNVFPSLLSCEATEDEDWVVDEAEDAAEAAEEVVEAGG